MSGHPGNGAAAALLLIDVQNSFFHKAGQNYYPQSAEALPALRQLLQAAREAQRPVIFAAERHRAGLPDFEAEKLPQHCVAGEFDAELVAGFGPQSPREILLAKRRMSAFHATDLDLLLRELRVGALIIGGVKTNVCVRATVQDGFSLGYRCHVVREAVNSNRRHLAEASLEDIDRYLGWIVTLEDGLRMLS